MTAHGTAASLLVLFGVLAFAVALASPGKRRAVAVPVALELLTAAGMVRLGGDPSWRMIAAAATVLVVRRLVLTSVRKPRVTRGHSCSTH